MSTAQIKQKGVVVMEKTRATVLGTVLCAVICGVFALGVGVGTNSKPAAACKSSDPLALLNSIEKDSGKSTEAEKDTELSFHTALVEEASAGAGRVSDEEGVAFESASAGAEISRPGILPVLKKEEPKVLIPPRHDEPGIYSLQVGSFRSLDEAREFASALIEKQHSSFIVPARDSQDSDSRRIFRVRIGPFDKKVEAEKYRSIFEEKERIPSFVVKTRL